MSNSEKQAEITSTSIINHMMFGRRKIFSSVDEVTPDNIISVLEKAYGVHLMNRGEINYLYDYYRGNQPILNRIKEIRPEICNNIVVNFAFAIVDFKVGYQCGSPMQYTAAKSIEGLSAKIEELNNLMDYENKATKDKDLIESQMICGTGYRAALPDDYVNSEEDEAPFEINNLRASNTFVIYSNKIGEKPLAGVTYWASSDYTGEFDEYTVINGYVFAIYTPKWYIEIKDGKIIRAVPNNLGMIPIIEYPLNNARLGSFEIVMAILDAISLVESNRLDGLQGFVQAFIKFINCDITKEEYEEFLAMGAIKVSSHEGKNADVDIVSKELSQDQAQTEVDDLVHMMLTICGMPAQGDANSSDSSNNGAMLVKNGWTSAESRAKGYSLMFEASEKELLKVIFKILRDKNVLDLKVSDIKMVFPRLNYENVQSKVQALVQMLDNEKIHPLDAYSHSGLFTDPETAYTNGMKWYNEQLDRFKVGEDDVPRSRQGTIEDTE